MPPVPTRSLTPRPYWSSPSCKLYHGDCQKILPQLPSQSVHLLVTDPPFNLGVNYSDCDDKLVDAEYLDWIYKWSLSCKRVMKPNGSLYIAICPRYQAEFKTILDSLGYYWRSTICSFYTFGPRQTTNWTPAWVAIHYYTMSSAQWTWNPPKVPSLRQLKYNDKRAIPDGKVPDSVWILNPRESAHLFEGTDMILESRVCGTFKERWPHPAQMNVNILKRIIQASSRPGDVVLDIMCGSGTTIEAAISLNRKAWGIELSQQYLDQCIIPRIKQHTPPHEINDG